MCYSALVWSDYKRYVREFGAHLDIREFVDLYVRRLGNPKIKVPKGMDDAFRHPHGDGEVRIKSAIDEFNAAQAKVIEEDLFKQKKRLADAERALLTKVTKKATEDQRISTDKIDKGLRRLRDLTRTDARDRDSRIFPGVWAPVMVMEEGKRVIKPMRYQCRPAGKPAFYDQKFPGLYNARLDNLQKFWRGQFGVTHGLMVVDMFYENVDRPGGSVVLEFHPEPAHPMLIACLWSHWKGPGEPDLLSFAAITDEPPEEVAAAGHDRCIVSIKPEHVEAWLNPDPARLEEQLSILADPVRPFYEHRLAA
ncbi:SOS response-associated peptidase family protein [Hydrogenophaga sp. 2FB]|uniref:SOS response-associated peptidase family protein n=1 Tax=Hydrogenophaga sp. 2FB TaxID=2502187 RepID=UPI0010F7BCE4|nr:SOS response-associated peptidase family protein [Hydrogenophaga sp. 2FB]